VQIRSNEGEDEEKGWGDGMPLHLNDHKGKRHLAQYAEPYPEVQSIPISLPSPLSRPHLALYGWIVAAGHLGGPTRKSGGKMGSTLIRKLSLVVLFPIGMTPTAVQGQYLRVTGSSVNVRQGPDVGSTVVGTAGLGDVFHRLGRTEEWYVIKMFSGEKRYIHASLAEPTESSPALPGSETTRRMAFEGFLRAEDRSFVEAEGRIPSSDELGNAELQRILDDRYRLHVCQGFPNIHPFHFEKIQLEGVQKGWDRIGDDPDWPTADWHFGW